MWTISSPNLSTQVPAALAVHASPSNPIEDIQRATPFFQEEPGTGGTGLILALAIGAINDDDAEAAADETRFRVHDADRQDLTQLLGLDHCPRMQPMLATLVGDRHFEVRHASAIPARRAARG